MNCAYLDYVKMNTPNRRKMYFSRIRLGQDIRICRKIFYRAREAAAYGVQVAYRYNRRAILAQRDADAQKARIP
jgi:hypothetical protein